MRPVGSDAKHTRGLLYLTLPASMARALHAKASMHMHALVLVLQLACLSQLSATHGTTAKLGTGPGAQAGVGRFESAMLGLRSRRLEPEQPACKTLSYKDCDKNRFVRPPRSACMHARAWGPPPP